MINHGRVYSSSLPEEMEITATRVFINSNVEPYTEEFDETTIEGYAYDCISYGKDEYLTTVALSNIHAIAELTDELQATKIILGVD